jgi:hypothetical protein
VFLAALLGGAILLPSIAAARVSILPIPRPIPPDWEPPVCPDPPVGYTYRWVAPTYRTVYERVWVEESTRRWPEWVEISPGVWEQRWRTVTVPAHFETTSRQVMVSAGYWQLVKLDPPPYDYPHPIPLERPVVNSRTVGVEGYSKSGGDDLSKFSPLSEWPDKK